MKFYTEEEYNELNEAHNPEVNKRLGVKDSEQDRLFMKYLDTGKEHGYQGEEFQKARDKYKKAKSTGVIGRLHQEWENANKQYGAGSPEERKAWQNYNAANNLRNNNYAKNSPIDKDDANFKRRMDVNHAAPKPSYTHEPYARDKFDNAALRAYRAAIKEGLSPEEAQKKADEAWHDKRVSTLAKTYNKQQLAKAKETEGVTLNNDVKRAISGTSKLMAEADKNRLKEYERKSAEVKKDPEIKQEILTDEEVKAKGLNKSDAEKAKDKIKETAKGVANKAKDVAVGYIKKKFFNHDSVELIDTAMQMIDEGAIEAAQILLDQVIDD